MDMQTVFDKVNGWSVPVSFDLSANTLVTKVKSEPLLRRVSTLTEKMLFDTYMDKTYRY